MKTAIKAAVIGAGHVGSHVAGELIRQGLCRELVLVDTDREKAKGHAADLMDTVAYLSHHVNVYAGWYDQVGDADIVVMCAAIAYFTDQDRLNELKPTLEVADDVIKGLKGCGFSGIIVSISNPCDIVAQYLQAKTGLTVIGTGTALDSARFRVRLSRALNIAAPSIQGYCMGEHGDSQVPMLSTVTAGGLSFSQLRDMYPRVDFNQICCDTVTAGWNIVQGKGNTEFGIAAAAARLVRAILYDEQAILPCSVLLNGTYEAPRIYASVPCIVGKEGAVPLGELPLTHEERQALSQSFQVLLSHLPAALREEK